MNEGTRTVTAWLLAALAFAAPGGAAIAQAAPPSSYQLPPASPTPDPRLQGPVVEDHPVAQPTTTDAPPKPPSAAPLAVPSPTPTASPRPAPAARRATASAATTPAATVPAQISPQPSPSSPATTAPEVTPLPLPSSAAASAPETPQAPAAPADRGDRWPWYIAALALAGGVALAMWRRAHRREKDAPAAPLRTPPLPPAGPLPTQPRQIPARPAPTLNLSLEARRFSSTLVNVSLDYRLRVTNAGAQPLADIAIGADMIGAHASLPTEAQLAQESATFEPLHRIAALAPGESAELSGTLRLPLAGAAAIRQGTAALFVPLVRLRAQAGADGPSFASTHVIGEVPMRPGSGLRPFRLDLGPRIYPEIEQRKLAIPA